MDTPKRPLEFPGPATTPDPATPDTPKVELLPCTDQMGVRLAVGDQLFPLNEGRPVFLVSRVEPVMDPQVPPGTVRVTLEPAALQIVVAPGVHIPFLRVGAPRNDVTPEQEKAYDGRIVLASHIPPPPGRRS